MERFWDWSATTVVAMVGGVGAYYLAVVEFAVEGVDWKYGPLVVAFLTAAAVGRIVRRVLPEVAPADHRRYPDMGPPPLPSADPDMARRWQQMDSGGGAAEDAKVEARLAEVDRLRGLGLISEKEHAAARDRALGL